MLSRRAIALFVAAVLIAGCGHPKKQAAKGRSASSSTTTTTEAAAGTPSTTAPTTSGKGGKGATTGTTAGGASPAPGDPTTLPAARPPSAGTYVYDQSTSADNGQPPSQAQLKVDAATGPAGDQRQTQRTVTGQAAQVRDWAWQPASLLLLDEHSEGNNTTSPTCDWQPDYRELALPLTLGATWTADSKCVSAAGTRHQTLSAKIVRFQRVAVGSDQVDVAVIQRSTTQDLGTAGVSNEKQYTDWFSPLFGLVVRSAGTAVSHIPGQPDDRIDFTSQLRSVHPS